MHRTFIVAALLGVFAATVLTADEPQPAPSKLETVAQRGGYAIGYDIGMRFEDSIDLDAMVRGFRDAIAEKESALSDEQRMQAVRTLQTQVMQAAARRNAEEGAEYRDANAKRDGVKVTDSGLQYEVIEEGDGPSPDASDTVTVHYRGTLIDGTEFDSSYERGEPATFPLNRVIGGWTEGLQLMNVGAKYRFVIPPELGYGQRGNPPIGPNATLVFEVELLGIESGE